MKIEQIHWDNAVLIKGMVNGIMSGSVIVDAYEANDIDIVCSLSDWNTAKTAYDWDNEFSGYALETTPTESNLEYDVSVYELHSTHKVGKVNILVYNPYFIPAIIASIRDMKSRPERYNTRDKRIALHQKYKQVIRDMLDENYAPPVAFQEI